MKICRVVRRLMATSCDLTSVRSSITPRPPRRQIHPINNGRRLKSNAVDFGEGLMDIK